MSCRLVLLAAVLLCWWPTPVLGQAASGGCDSHGANGTTCLAADCCAWCIDPLDVWNGTCVDRGGAGFCPASYVLGGCRPPPPPPADSCASVTIAAMMSLLAGFLAGMAVVALGMAFFCRSVPAGCEWRR